MAAVRQGDVPVQGWSPGSAPTEAPDGTPRTTGPPRALPDRRRPGRHRHPGLRRPRPGPPGRRRRVCGLPLAPPDPQRRAPADGDRPHGGRRAGTYALTRTCPAAPPVGSVRCAELCRPAAALWIVLLVVHRGVVADVLGVVSLALALSSWPWRCSPRPRTPPHRPLLTATGGWPPPDQPPVDRVAPALYRQTG